MKRKLLLFLVLFCAASATFAAQTYYTVTWMINGNVVDSAPVQKNQTTPMIAYNENFPIAEGYEFAGWAASVIDNPTSEEPSMLQPGANTPQVKGDMTYYAVFKSKENAVVGVNYQRATSLKQGGKYIYACDLGNGTGYVMLVNNLATNGNSVFVEGKQVTIASGAISGNLLDCEMNFMPGSYIGNTMNPDSRDQLSLFYSNTSNAFIGFTIASHSSSSTIPDFGAQFVPFEASTDGNGLSVTAARVGNFNLYHNNIPTENMPNYYVMMNNNYQFVLTNNESDANIHAYERTEITGALYTTKVSDPYITLVAKSGDYYYGTFSNPNGIIIPTTGLAETRVVEALVSGDKVTLNNVSQRDDNKVIDGSTTSYTGYYVPAGTGVLIKSVLSTISFKYTVATKNTNNINGLNKLVSTNDLVAKSNCQYFKLAYGNYDGYYNNNNDLLGFWWGAPDGALFTPLKPNLAVLEVPSEIQIKGIVFLDDDEVTAITAVEAKKEANAQTYNLAGQRVNANTKGIVIKNGKKYLNK